jgi:hypothetical protein
MQVSRSRGVRSPFVGGLPLRFIIAVKLFPALRIGQEREQIHRFPPLCCEGSEPITPVPEEIIDSLMGEC